MKMKTYEIEFSGQVDGEVEAEKIEFYVVPDSREVIVLFLVDSQIVAAVRNWDSVYEV